MSNYSFNENNPQTFKQCEQHLTFNPDAEVSVMDNMSDHTSVRSSSFVSAMFMHPRWPLVVSPPCAFATPPWDSYSTGWQSEGWETSIKVQPCHVNGRTTAILLSERTASHMPLKEDFNGVSHRMCVRTHVWVFEWRRGKKRDSH